MLVHSCFPQQLRRLSPPNRVSLLATSLRGGVCRRTFVLLRSLVALAAVVAPLVPASAAIGRSADPRFEQALRVPVARTAARIAAAPVASAHNVGTGDCVSCNGIRLQDEIVLINTRPVGCSTNPDKMASRLQLKSYEISDDAGHRRWQPYDMESLAAADPSVTTVFFVHGNQVSPGQDRQISLSVYRRLVRHHCSAEPIRFVIFSWPSSKIRGPLKDYRVKAARTRPVGWELAWVLDKIPGETPIGLIGYSYGARIITGGLHILGGGQLSGLGLDERVHPDREPVRVVLIAAALHAHWLGPNQYHGQAMSQVDRMLLLNNCQDMAMRFYHLSATNGDPQALGLCGPTCITPEDAAKIRNRDLSRYDGPRHDLFRYLGAPGAMDQTWRYTTFDDIGR